MNIREDAPPKQTSRVLTKETARAIRPGETIKCHVVAGLELRGRPTVTSWHLYYRAADGTQRRPKLGTFPALSIEAARNAAREWLARIAKGEDPSADRQEKRAAPTVADLAAWYMENHARPNKTPRSAEEDARNIKRHVLPRLGGHRVAELTSADVRAALNGIAEAAGAVTSNRVRALLSKMLSLAESDALAWRPKRSNPIDKDVPQRPEFARRRVLSREELDRVRAAFDEVAATYPRRAAALLAILYCGSRVTELVTAKWDHVEGDRIVRRDHKSARTGEPRVIHFPEQVRALVAGLPPCPRGFIFGEECNRHTVFDVWQIVRDRAGVPDVQVRDLRRTFASAARSAGLSLSQTGDLLGHTQSRTTERYAYLFDETKRIAAQQIADALDEKSHK